MICSGFDKLETCNTAVNADNISISSNTCLKDTENKICIKSVIHYKLLKFIVHFYRLLLVQNMRSFLPLGGCFFNKTNNACNVRFEYLGPIGP